MIEAYPWNQPELRGWDIIGMNHFHIRTDRHLFVAMVNRETKLCIKAEGYDEVGVFGLLVNQARNLKIKEKNND